MRPKKKILHERLSGVPMVFCTPEGTLSQSLRRISYHPGLIPWSVNARDARRGGLGVETPILLPRATTFLVKILSAAFNAVPPELVVLISTTSSGRTELNAVSTKKMVARGRTSPKIGVSTPSPPRLGTSLSAPDILAQQPSEARKGGRPGGAERGPLAQHSSGAATASIDSAGHARAPC